MSSIDHFYGIVEECIRDLGLEPETTRQKDETGAVRNGSWTLYKGSAQVWIDVWHIEKEGRPYFQVMCPVMTFPEAGQQPALFQELLEINDKLFGVAFTIYQKRVWLKTIRECEGLDKSEAMAQITRVGNYSDQYDDYLKDKYPPTSAEAGGFSAGPPSGS